MRSSGSSILPYPFIFKMDKKEVKELLWSIECDIGDIKELEDNIYEKIINIFRDKFAKKLEWMTRVKPYPFIFKMDKKEVKELLLSIKCDIGDIEEISDSIYHRIVEIFRHHEDLF